MAIGKCKYCNKDLLNKASTICENCHTIWLDGYREGENSIRDKLKEIFHALKNLAREE